MQKSDIVEQKFFKIKEFFESKGWIFEISHKDDVSIDYLVTTNIPKDEYGFIDLRIHCRDDHFTISHNDECSDISLDDEILYDLIKRFFPNINFFDYGNYQVDMDMNIYFSYDHNDYESLYLEVGFFASSVSSVLQILNNLECFLDKYTIQKIL